MVNAANSKIFKNLIGQKAWILSTLLEDVTHELMEIQRHLKLHGNIVVDYL